MPVPRRWILAVVCLGAIVSGCEPLSGDALVIATSWPPADRIRLETEFAGWLGQHATPSARVRIDWLILAPGDDLEKLAARRHPPDVLLGGNARAYERLTIAKRLSPLPIDGSPAWVVVRKSDRGERAAAAIRRIPFDDPRNDPISLAWAETQLGRGQFREGYARLVEAAGSAAAPVEPDRNDRAGGTVPANQDAPNVAAIPWIEGAAIVADGPHPDQAALFLNFLSETNRATPMPARPEHATADDLDLLAELLGATLVDARDELWSAWEGLERAGSPPTQRRWMTEPPPWPPASIAKILGGQGEQAMVMVETLAGQLAPDPSARAWLISSWLSPPRPIDREVLEALTHAAEGRLFREPRFGEWLRAEWTAWARQRYRRVLRIVEGGRGQTTLTTDH